MRLLKDFIGKRKNSDETSFIDDKTVFFIFRKIIREEYGLRGISVLEPVLFIDGILSVKASNPLYSSELWIRREIILNKICLSLGQDTVRELRLVRYAP